MNAPITLSASRIAILGLGLMGGSLALALRGKCKAIYAYDPDPQTVTLARQRQIVDLASQEPVEILTEIRSGRPGGSGEGDTGADRTAARNASRLTGRPRPGLDQRAGLLPDGSSAAGVSTRSAVTRCAEKRFPVS